MPCGCSDKKNLNKNLDMYPINTNLSKDKILNLNNMKNMSIDEIIKLYQEGYILENKQSISTSISTLALSSPEIVDVTGNYNSSTGMKTALILWKNNGGYGFVSLELWEGSFRRAKYNLCSNPRTGLSYFLMRDWPGTVPMFIDAKALKCNTDGEQSCPAATCTNEIVAHVKTDNYIDFAYSSTSPSSPILSKTEGDMQLTVSWTAVTNTDIFAYKLKIVDNTTGTTIDEGYLPANTFSYIFHNLINGRPYTIYVYALSVSNMLGSQSSIVGTPTLSCPTPIISISCPTSPVARGTAADISATLTTAGTPNYTYKLYVDNVPGPTFGPTYATSHTFSHLFNETAGPHTYKVEATDSCPSGAKTISSSCTLTISTCPVPIISITCPQSPIIRGTVGNILATITSAGIPNYTYKLYVDDVLADTFGPTSDTSKLFPHTFNETAGSHTYRVDVTDSCINPGPSKATKNCILTIQGTGACTSPIVNVTCPASIARGSTGDIVATLTTSGTSPYTYKLYVDDVPTNTSSPKTATTHTFTHVFNETVASHTYKVVVIDSCTDPGPLTALDICTTTITQEVPSAGTGGAMVIAAVAALALAYLTMKK